MIFSPFMYLCKESVKKKDPSFFWTSRDGHVGNFRVELYIKLTLAMTAQENILIHGNLCNFCEHYFLLTTKANL